MNAFAQMARVLTTEPPTLAERRRDRNRRYQQSNRELWKWYRRFVQPIGEMARLFKVQS